MSAVLDVADIRSAATALGLANRPLELHASLSSFGDLAGGASAVVDGLLDVGCTVMVAAFTTHVHQVDPATVPIADRPARNALDDVGWSPTPAGADGRRFSADANDVNAAYGAVVAEVVQRADRARGDHPLNSFAAAGPLATTLVAQQTMTDVYAPIRTLAEHAGALVLMGTGLDKMTLIHAAEQAAGRALFVRWARTMAGVQAVRVGSCSRGFERLAPVLRPIEQRAAVGGSLWRVFPAADALAIAADAIRSDPTITHCDDACALCDAAVAGGPLATVP